MFWVFILSALATVRLLFGVVHWRTKQRYKRYNAVAWNFLQLNHHSGGGGAGF
ncbi:hypothetical protein P8610_10200 [Fictibacillus sp. UD]|uniref:hypothetical protein n=1 Tax=Fictibacillus sp. UD TaxID=3038777 RepID=UPI003746F058